MRRVMALFYSSAVSVPPTITVNIRNLAFGGEGVGEVTAAPYGEEALMGITAFVPFTINGEVVTAQVVQRKDRYLKAQLSEVVTPSHDRVTPECQYYTVCGGCELQHMNYPAQLDAKLEMVRGSMLAARIGMETVKKLQPIIYSEPYNYRRRVALHVSSSGQVGFYRTGSRSVVAIGSCSVAVPEINEALASIQDFGRLIQGKISSILLEADREGLVCVLKSPYDLTPQERDTLLQAAKPFFQNVSLMAGEKEVGGYGRLILELPLNEAESLVLRVPAGYFSQVNTEINRALISHVIQGLGALQGKKVFDLYGGAGNFALPLANMGARVTAVDCDERLISFGLQSVKHYALEKNLKFVCSSTEKFLEKPGDKPDLIVADPPRSGLGPLTGPLTWMLKAERMCLVSCHLPSFVRDLKALVSEGWVVETIQPFDMFAQTSYLEILTVLSHE